MDENKIISCDLIVKSNELIEAKYKLTVTEQKIIYKLITIINKDDCEFKIYRFSIRELMDLIDTKSKATYSLIRESIKNLQKKVFILKDKEKNQDLQISWISSALYKNGEGIVELEFSPRLKPYLLQLKQAFTKFNLKDVIQLRSSYSCRIYEFLKQYERLNERTLTVKEIKEKLCIVDEYTLYSNFKKKVILQAQKELKEKTDLQFDFEEIKIGRKVESIKFIIKPNEKEKPIVQSDIDHLSNGDIDAIHQYAKNVISNKISLNLIKKLLNDYGEEKVNFYLQNWSNFSTQSINNKIGFFVDCVKKNYNFPEYQIGKPIQSMNYEQRQYDDDHYDSLYANLNPEIDD